MTIKGIKIQERDKQLFRYLQKFGFLNTRLIKQLCFTGISNQAVALRLKKLVDYHYIKRSIPRGELEYWYYINEDARIYLDNEKPIKRLNPKKVIHDIGLAETMVHLYTNYPEYTVLSETDLSFLESREFKTIKEHKNKTETFTLNFLPDGLIQLKDPDALYFIEYDRTTEFGLQLKQKLWAYEEYFKSEGFKRDFGEELTRFRVLLICQGIERIESILRLYKNEFALELFVMATYREFISTELPIHSAIWWHVRKEGRFALSTKSVQ